MIHREIINLPTQVWFNVLAIKYIFFTAMDLQPHTDNKSLWRFYIRIITWITDWAARYYIIEVKINAVFYYSITVIILFCSSAEKQSIHHPSTP